MRRDGNDAGVLDLGVLRELLEREDGEAREGRLEEALDREAGLGGDDEDGGAASGEVELAALNIP